MYLIMAQSLLLVIVMVLMALNMPYLAFVVLVSELALSVVGRIKAGDDKER